MLKEEEKLQITIINTFEKYRFLNQIKHSAFLHSNRNENNKGSLNGIIAGGIMNKMGRIAGLPDLTLIYKKNNVLKMAYIELKTPKAYFTPKGNVTKNKGLQPSQIAFKKNYVDPLSIPYSINYDVDGVINFLKELDIL